MEEAKKLGKEVVIVDTAGRLQVDDELMGQLKDVKDTLKDPEVLLVADAMTGQEAVNVAKVFHEKIGLTGAVLSKMDSDARGGAALSIKYVTNVPIRFISVGEKMKELEPFHPDRLAKRILDMGDVVSLVEKAQDAIDEKEAERMMKRLEKQQFSIDDFVKQMEQINKLGSMSSILKMIPGMGGMLRQVGDLSQAEDEMKKMKILINSMTRKEKDNHKLINDSRISRIAKGSGTSEQEVKDFIKKFEQMQSMMVGMMGMMKGGGMPNIPGMPPMPGFRQQAAGKKGKAGKKKSQFGNKFFK
jgi:signal recognition particle subunit SRP54